MSDSRRSWFAAPLALVSALVFTGTAAAAPTGEDVIAGDVQFHRDGSLTLIRASDGAIINYESFDIFAGEVVRFIQPGADARVLNRVFGDATRIEGSLFSNGIVYIVNPAGIFLDGNAVVEVGGLVAAAGSITNEDFLAGVDRFDLAGDVVNAGEIQAADVALLGSHVANHGRIQAPEGTIALVAGDKVVLTQIGGRILVEVDGPPAAAEAGIVQTGSVDAGEGRALFAVGDHYSLAINHDGLTRAHEIELDGGDGLVKVAGTLDATSDDVGGSVHVLGDRVGLFDATVDASGDAGGGEIRIGGDRRGEGELPTSSRTVVDAVSVLRADARESGDGGSIVVWGDEATVVAGRLSARGGVQGGDGGFAEISSLGLLRSEGVVDLGATHGERGTLLYDPQDIVIFGGTDDGSDGSATNPDASDTTLTGDDGTLGQILAGVLDDPATPEDENAENPGDLGDGTDPFEIYESEIEGTDANIVLEARNSITTSGAFTNEVDGEGVGVLVLTDGNDLTLSTENATGDDVGSAFAPGIDLGTLTIRASGGGSVFMRTGASGDLGTVADVSVGDITAPGGDVAIVTTIPNESTEGAITTGDIDTSGLDGDAGDDAGTIGLQTGGDHALIAGTLTARGGAGATGAGGDGGVVQTFSGGALTVGDVDASGGAGATDGGRGAGIDLRADEGNPLVAGNLVTRGGDGTTGIGGDTSGVSVTAQGGDVTVGAITSTGGSGATRGGAGGSITVGNFVDPDSVGDVLLLGPVTSLGGAGTAMDSDGDGGAVTLQAAEALDFDAGVAGPHIVMDGARNSRASGSPTLQLLGETIGAVQTIEIDAGGEVNDPGPTGSDTLSVLAEQSADVAVTNAGFNRIEITGGSSQASIDITQAPEEVGGNPVTIDIDGGAVNRIVRIDTRQIDAGGNTVGSQVDVQYGLNDVLEDADDISIGLEVASGAVTAGGSIVIFGEDGVTLENDAIAMHEILDPTDGTGTDTTGDLRVIADADRAGDGALLDQGGASIDMNADAVANAGRATLEGVDGVGTAANPLEFENASGLSVGSEEGGIHLRQTAGGDVQLFGLLDSVLYGPEGALVVSSGAGDIDVENATGNLDLVGAVRTSDDGMGNAGNIRLAAPGGEIRFLRNGTTSDGLLVPAASGTAIETEGDLTFDADVRLERDVTVSSPGIVSLQGANSGAARRDLVIQGAGLAQLNADLGTDTPLRDFVVEGDVQVLGDRSIAATRTVRFDSAIDADVVDVSSLTVDAAQSVEFGADVGANTRLLGVVLDSAAVRFTNDGVAQQISAGAGGIQINAAGGTGVPPIATVGKPEGDLTLTTPGAIAVGPNEKISAGGRLQLVGDSVRVGDLSALDIEVDATTIEVQPREGGTVLRADGSLLTDFGTDWVANTITTTSAPVVLPGPGATPVAGTLSGTIAGAGGGGLVLAALPGPISAGDLMAAGVSLDLSLPLLDTGNETPEAGPPVLPLRDDVRTSDRPARGTAQPPSADRLLGAMRCAAVEGPESCPAPDEGSALDSPRAGELFARFEALFGASDAARAARASLADPAGAESRAALRDLATLLVQVRMMGIGQREYETLRDALLAELAPAAETRQALLDAVRQESRGVAL